jgi:hypothetical protein
MDNCYPVLMEVKATVDFILGFMVIFVTAFVGWVSVVNKVRRGDKSQEQGEPMPRVNGWQLVISVLGQLFQRPRRRKYSMTTKKLVNLGDVNPIPEVPPELERWMARELLRELDGGKMADEVSLSVDTWVTSGLWKGTQKEFAALMDKWQEEGIVYRKNRRGDRAFVQPSRPSIRARMKAKVK